MSSRVKALLGVAVYGLSWLACVPAQRSVAPHAQPAPKPTAVQAELRGTPPPVSTPALPGAPATPPAQRSAPPASSAVIDDSPPECVEPTDPELEKESPWSREIGQRLERALPRLERCSRELPDKDAASITLRFVYGKDGSPTSQHVVTSTPSACAASECLKRELGSIRSPRLYIDKASIDLTLQLARGQVPVRVHDAVDPLTPEAAPVGAQEGCVDPEVARLSQAAVRDIVSGSYDGLQRCYGEALSRDHGATGRVSFEFVIGQSGSVARAWAREATLRDCEAIDCMLAQFRALSFPEPVGRSVRVIYPINYVLEQQPVSLR